tara:strand:- start:1918 stop:2181 length:264 start_codon:yes stop_codon:yes gene_type:complete
MGGPETTQVEPNNYPKRRDFSEIHAALSVYYRTKLLEIILGSVNGKELHRRRGSENTAQASEPLKAISRITREPLSVPSRVSAGALC